MSKVKERISSRSNGFKSFRFVRQIDSSDCGAACLAMISQWFGSDLLLSEARGLCGANAAGSEICSAAKSLGLDAEFRRLKFHAIQDMAFPLVAHWHGNHWVVILDKNEERIKIADPAAGIYWLPLAEATEAYSGYICQISGDVHSGKRLQRTNWLLPCLSPFKKVIIPTALLMLMTVLAEVLIPYILQRLLDENLFEDERIFRQWIFYAALAGSVVFIGQAFQGWLLNRAASKSESLLLEQLLNRWLSMPADFFKDRNFRELRLRFESVFKIKYFLQETAGSLLFALLELIAIFALLEHYGSALLYAVMLFPALVLIVFTFVLSRRQAGALALSKESFLSNLDDMTKGVFSIRHSGAEDFFKVRKDVHKEKMQQVVSVIERNMIFCEKGAMALGLSSALLLFYFAGKDYMDGQSTAGTMLAILVLSVLALNSLYRILQQRTNFESGAIVYDYLHDVFDSDLGDEQKVYESSTGSLEWKDCWLKGKDAGGEPFNYKIPANSSCFIAGESQSLVRYLFCNNTSLDGELIIETAEKTYSSKDILPETSFMEEFAHIFNISVYENIALGQDIDEKRVRWCLRMALCDDLIDSLQYGLQTKLIEANLSYEDKMKLVLARTLYRKSAAYILQDLSHFLNSEELLIFGYHLQCHLNDRTVIVLDSDLVLSKYCSQVAIVYNGKLKECGTAVELAAANGIYSQILKG